MNRNAPPASQPDTGIPPVVKTLLLVNIAVFAVQQPFFSQMLHWLALWPVGIGELYRGARGAGLPGFQPWQLVTYGFLHGSLMHLFFNMFALWMLGSRLERFWGSYHFLVFYFVCVVGAGLVQLYVVSSDLASSGIQPTLGASGGVFGILMAFGMMFPNDVLMLLFPPIPMRAKYFVIVYGIVELTLGVTAPHSSVAHFAHLGGMAFGFVLIQYWRGRLPLKPRWFLNR